MTLWGIGMLILGTGAMLAAIRNWDWWFRINSAGGLFVHDAFGRMFARSINFVVSAILVVVGIADMSGAWPVSAVLDAWITNDRARMKALVAPGPEREATWELAPESSSGRTASSVLPTYAE